MKSKTCGECCYFDERYNLCAVTSDFCTVDAGDSACDDFEQKPKPTNGDKIRQMSNRELSEISVYKDMIPDGEIIYRSTLLVDKFFLTKNCAVSVVEAYLNSPANCVKQNGDHDTQADLCKVDNTEREGEK